MLNLAEINSAVQETFLRELKVTSDAIKANMQKNNQVASGETLLSIREDFQGDTGSIYGFDHIDTLETGISPQRSQATSWRESYAGMVRWYQNKHGYSAQGNNDRLVSSAVHKQRTMGSVMWRNGITKNVYSQEVEPLVRRISDAIGEKIVNIKILGNDTK